MSKNTPFNRWVGALVATMRKSRTRTALTQGRSDFRYPSREEMARILFDTLSNVVPEEYKLPAINAEFIYDFERGQKLLDPYLIQAMAKALNASILDKALLMEAAGSPGIAWLLVYLLLGIDLAPIEQKIRELLEVIAESQSGSDRRENMYILYKTHQTVLAEMQRIIEEQRQAPEQVQARFKEIRCELEMSKQELMQEPNL